MRKSKKESSGEFGHQASGTGLQDSKDISAVSEDNDAVLLKRLVSIGERNFAQGRTVSDAALDERIQAILNDRT